MEILANTDHKVNPLYLSQDLQQPTAQNNVQGKISIPHILSGKPTRIAKSTKEKPTPIEINTPNTQYETSKLKSPFQKLVK